MNNLVVLGETFVKRQELPINIAYFISTEVHMKKLRIIIADEEKSYIESLSSYFRTSDDASRFIPNLFTTKTALQEFLNTNDLVDILLISPDLYDESLHIPKETSLIFLEDNKMNLNRSERQTVYRYQRLNQLVSNILAIYYENNQHAGKLLARSKQTEVITVYSPIGGSGKTTIATNLSKQLALNNLKVFYLNLELLNTTKLFFQSEEDNPSLQIFYYVKSQSPQLLSKIESLKKYDAHSNVSYFDIEISADELLEINEEDVKRLINAIVETSTYDFIVVDLDSSLHERNIAALKECDRIIWPISNDDQGLLKTASLLAEEERIFGKDKILKDKLMLVMNKFYGEKPNIENDYDLTLDGFLPFVESWVIKQSGRSILTNDLFNQELLSLVHERVINPERTVVTSE